VYVRVVWINALLVSTASAASFPMPARFAPPLRFGIIDRMPAPIVASLPVLPGSQSMQRSQHPLAVQTIEAARNRGVAPDLLLAVVAAESGFDPNARSPKGAEGVTQILPATARDPGFGVAPLKEKTVAEYLRFGADYLVAMLTRYGGNRRKALAAYNAGPGTVDRHRGIVPYAETQRYVARICAQVGCP
jgi:soluble lytic murein transglycosylase-like protein